MPIYKAASLSLPAHCKAQCPHRAHRFSYSPLFFIGQPDKYIAVQTTRMEVPSAANKLVTRFLSDDEHNMGNGEQISHMIWIIKNNHECGLHCLYPVTENGEK